MAKHLRRKPRSMRETMAYACRILAMTEQEAGLAGQISVRSERPGAYWTLRFGLGFDEATPEDFIEVDRDLNTLTGDGMPNPATRFHLWVYDARPDVNSIIHTHSPWASALAAARQPLVIAQMDMTPLHNDCAFLGEWPGVPIADQEGVIISEALGNKRSIILAHHGYLTAGTTCEEATYLSVYRARRPHADPRAGLWPAHPGERRTRQGGARLSAQAFDRECDVRLLVPADPRNPLAQFAAQFAARSPLGSVTRCLFPS